MTSPFVGSWSYRSFVNNPDLAVSFWPNGIAQIPAIVGSVIRTAPHSDCAAAAGFVGSFVAVRQP